MVYPDIKDVPLNEIAKLLSVLCDETRLKIMRYLSEKEGSLHEIVEEVGEDPSYIATHLQMLMSAGLLTSRKDVLTIYYTIADPIIKQMCEVICGAYQKLVASKR